MAFLICMMTAVLDVLKLIVETQVISTAGSVNAAAVGVCLLLINCNLKCNVFMFFSYQSCIGEQKIYVLVQMSFHLCNCDVSSCFLCVNNSVFLLASELFMSCCLPCHQTDLLFHSFFESARVYSLVFCHLLIHFWS